VLHFEFHINKQGSPLHILD